MKFLTQLACAAVILTMGFPLHGKKTRKTAEAKAPVAKAVAKKSKAPKKSKLLKKADPPPPWDCTLARSARLSVNSSQQSCEPSRNPKGIKKMRVRDSVCKPLTEKKPKGLNCETRKPAAAYGGGKRMEVINKLIDPTPDGKTDCSGFASGVFCRAGARLRPYKSCELTHTAELMALGNTNDCFETHKFTAKNQVRPGCMILWRKGNYGHVVVVEKVGKDPFGLKQGCAGDPMDFNHWNFEVAESATRNGPTIYDARRRFSKNGDVDREAMMLLRKRLCQSVTENKPMFAAAWEDDLTAKILCHVGTARQGCVDKSKRFFKNEACIAHCTQ